jgi:hypothetical protein
MWYLKNRTNDTLYSVKVYAWVPKLELADIAPGATTVGHMDMSSEPRSDGGYNLLYKDKEGNEIVLSAGYFTLGRPLERRMTITIESDTSYIHLSNFGRSFKKR